MASLPLPPLWIAAVIGLALGAIVGSFLATVLIRWPAGRSALGGRSACDGCDAALGAAELVPVLSWALQRGRCRRCGAAIDIRHPAMEIGAALIGLIAALALSPVAALITALFGWWLLLIAALDAEHQWLPDRLTFPLIVAGLLVAWLGIGPVLEDRLIGAAAGFTVLAAIGLLYRLLRERLGLGGGDPKLLAAIGAWLGWAQLPLVLLGAGLVGLAAIAARWLRGERIAATDRLPLGTLMAVTAWPLWLVVTRLS
ncbi:prepilin peptidase [Allosphingosinicella indica]|uniref:Prepilin leader peptidase/N-methyltransferase n=1 Tax=Allosphingosinicella indica TaxID=941907 RepID=A0A1X7H321_9SPHN|nr:A24 family peptidase [Allosphingosinicella indica]SMF78056.1 leader peptidase (prepilin peptidase) / N-methyltransferase [Allosphingosinicella indica]